MKNTYLCGYYGMQNSGDDALLCAAINGAKAYFNSESYTINTPERILVPNAGAFDPKINHVQRFSGENRILQCYNAMQSDQIIFGGGSVLHCKRDMDTKYLMMKLAGKGPHLALGVGVEAFESTAAEKSCRRFLNRCDYVGVRDEAGYDIATAIAPNANIELTFDLAPSLLPMLNEKLPVEAHRFSKNDTVNRSKRRGVGVLLCPRESIREGSDITIEQQRLKDLTIALADIYRKTGQPIFIFDMNGHATLGDSDIHDELQRLLPANVPVFRYGYQSNPLRLIRQLSRLQFSIAMRLHGSIFSYLAGTPVLSINYHDKCEGWCKQIGLPDKYQFDAGEIDVQRMVSSAVNGLTRSFEGCQLALESAYRESIKNFTSPLKLA